MLSPAAHVSVVREWSSTVRLRPRVKSESLSPLTLERNNTRHPPRSNKKVATKMETVLTNPTATVAEEKVVIGFDPCLLEDSWAMQNDGVYARGLREE